MTTLIRRLFGKKKEEEKKEVFMPVNSHEDRYLFDHEDMASIPNCYGIGTVIEGDNKYEGFYYILKSVRNIPGLRSFVKVRTYSAAEGEIATFTFPEPKSSPEVKYGICIFRYTDIDYENLYEYTSPYYIMEKIVDRWAIGEIKAYNLGKGERDKYVTTYYKTMDTPDLLQFVKWVMEKESFTAERPEENDLDPITLYLDKAF
ncbi:MAG: hypothetical protein ACI4DK_11410 [Lachnospiraceae bacterium]